MPNYLDNLIDHYRCDDASGADFVGVNGLTFTDHNTTGTTTGKIGSARSFAKASTNYGSRADDANFSVADIDFLVTCWVKLTSKSANMAIFGKCNDPSTDVTIPYLLSYNTSLDRFRFTVGDGVSLNQAVLADNLGAVSTATWYFLAAWHDSVANKVRISVNAQATPDEQAYSGGSFNDTGITELGALNNVGSPIIPFDGLIDELSFFKRTPYTGELTARYNAGNGLAFPWSNTGMFFGC